MSAVATWLRRALAFAIRDFREMRSYRLSFFFQIYGICFSILPFFFIDRMFAGISGRGLEAFGGAYFPYVFVGITFLGFMTTGMGVFAAFIRQGQMTGTLEAMLVTPTSLTTLVTASATGAFLRGAASVLLYLVVGSLLGIDLARAAWGGAILVLVLSVAAFSGLGILSAAFVLAFKKGNPATVVFGGVSTLLSGVLFPPELLPQWAQVLSRLVPLTHALGGMRRAILGGAGPLAIRGELLALGLWSAVVLPLAVVAFRLAVRHAKREGSLAQY